MTRLPKTFCAFPFHQINVTNDGKARLCCRTHDEIRQGDRPLSLHTETFQQIWNSDGLRKVRRSMIDGKEIASCAGCYATEADGGTSLRHIANTYARYMLDAPDDEAVLAKSRAIVREQRGFAPPPSGLHLWLGNLCNLKCRMCCPAYSSQIAADRVHSAWRGDLSRSAMLLPDYLEGVDYTGFGELVKRGEKASRIVSDKQAAISLRSNGDPIATIEISGLKRSPWPCRLSLRAEGRLVATKWLRGKSWKTWIHPDPSWHPASPLHLSLHFGGSRRSMEIGALKITTRATLGKKHPREIVSRIPENPHWARNREVVFDEVLAHPECLRQINFSGGEPMINPMFPAILERLIESGHAEHITLYITSNATIHSTAISGLLQRFRSVEIGFSVDGVGPLQEYIRPPSDWRAISRNVLAYVEDGIPVSIRPTVQAYNIFGVLDLVRLCTTHRIRFVLDNILYNPEYLSLDMLPQAVVDEALEEWQAYRDRECAEDNRWHVETVLAALRRPRSGRAEMEVLQDQFIRFTNDLDRSRGQSFAEVCPRLHGRLVAAGFDFHGKYRFSNRRSSARESIPKSIHGYLQRLYRRLRAGNRNGRWYHKAAFVMANRVRRWVW